MEVVTVSLIHGEPKELPLVKRGQTLQGSMESSSVMQRRLVSQTTFRPVPCLGVSGHLREIQCELTGESPWQEPGGGQWDAWSQSIYFLMKQH